MIANFINRDIGRVSLRGVAWVQHAALTAAMGSSSTLLATRPRRVCGGPRTRATRLATWLKVGSPPQRERWCGAIPG